MLADVVTDRKCSMLGLFLALFFLRINENIQIPQQIMIQMQLFTEKMVVLTILFYHTTITLVVPSTPSYLNSNKN